jgi:hypothetical protein
MCDMDKVLRITIRDADDLTSEVITYARREYSTDNGWISIVPFYRVYYRLELADNGFILEAVKERSERINESRKSRCLRSGHIAGFYYEKCPVDRSRLFWTTIQHRRREEDAIAKQIADEEYTCDICGFYAQYNRTTCGHKYLCYHCAEHHDRNCALRAEIVGTE